MFKNPGKKVKTLAIILFILMSLVPIIAGIGLILVGTSSVDIPMPESEIQLEGLTAIIAGIVIIIFGVIMAWISALMLYTVGAISDDLQTLRKAGVLTYHLLEDKKETASAVTVKVKAEQPAAPPVIVPDYEDEVKP